MTYLELIKTTLKFIKSENLASSYYDFWYMGDPKKSNKNKTNGQFGFNVSYYESITI